MRAPPHSAGSIQGAPRAWKLAEAYTDAGPKRPIYPDYQTRVVLFKRSTAENCYTNQAGAPECNEIATAGHEEQTRSINK